MYKYSPTPGKWATKQTDRPVVKHNPCDNFSHHLQESMFLQVDRHFLHNL